MGNEVTRNIHFSLQSFNEALLLSVCDPVCINSGIPHQDFDRIFFDMAEDDVKAKNLMHKRIRYNGEVITSFMQQHEKLVDLFATIEEAANTKSLYRVKEATQEFTQIYRENIELIKNFRTEPENVDDLFLDYPYTLLMVNHKNLFGSRIFNKNKNYIGANREAEMLESLLEKAKSIEFGSILEIGARYEGGISPGSGGDTSYRGRLEFVKTLLKKAIE